MAKYLELMIPLTAILMPVMIVLIVFWHKNESDARKSEIIKNGIEKGYPVEEIKKMLNMRDN